MSFSPDQWLNLVAGIVLGTLGVVVVVAAPRRLSALSFAVLAISLAVLYLFEAMQATLPLAVDFGLLFLVTLGAVGLMLLFPTPVAGAERRVVALALGTACMFTLVGAGLAYDSASSAFHDWASMVYWTGDVLHGIVFLAATMVFPLRTLRLAREHAGAARSLAIVAIGMFLFTSGSIGLEVGSPIKMWLDAAYALIPIALWLLATRGHHARVARNVVLGAVFIDMGSLLLNAAGTTYAYPLGRIVGAFFLGYAVLRGQVAGLDLKVRFAISKSTIAAVFIAVFFIASEVAQQFFGEQSGSTYIGIGIAGTLVFAMAPIQRAAEKLAEQAVPTATPPVVAPPGSSSLDVEDAYRAAVWAALADGAMTDQEEEHLADVAHALALSPRDALRIRRAVQSEASA